MIVMRNQKGKRKEKKKNTFERKFLVNLLCGGDGVRGKGDAAERVAVHRVLEIIETVVLEHEPATLPGLNATSLLCKPALIVRARDFLCLDIRHRGGYNFASRLPALALA